MTMVGGHIACGNIAAGIAKARLGEERKQWRKSHPYVSIHGISDFLNFLFTLLFDLNCCTGLQMWCHSVW